MTVELHTIVVYDVEDDRDRNKIADVCKDFGLIRFQLSGFEGRLTTNRREMLALRVRSQLRRGWACVSIIPICERDLRARISVVTEARSEGGETHEKRPALAPATEEH